MPCFYYSKIKLKIEAARRRRGDPQVAASSRLKGAELDRDERSELNFPVAEAPKRRGKFRAIFKNWLRSLAEIEFRHSVFWGLSPKKVPEKIILSATHLHKE
ncbi:hypothetical protein COS93_00450 [bacterium (Candidatus Gribaldobacteria) CG07_land_8_20_14_0_80_33_18]|uniref:Uncharacterized protein n=1 Tax=bacterium (Candidatus Gribaldobacteria) CG07_land_8_20_14_0_80_33_18 TaxID=2014272 RepID=A0A2M6Z473_9BACT|nr:MAG: hypothetical protein COS93_00450 [bacterium (Candidatus Gribaldobacteria) CG07_land_8_20_14_0_80_33_18]